ncbi:hypothetical protein GPECTOR_1g485 [Gonium pectorale]|uniref:Uncharacterized protein n=1 Tax=Gonium pectorale TaxID=33097 RepID=A0A150H4M3_GONPE|nr:hypothetical protein GPECTOR_1g485 [Gonium pectorale]|eukprot:KXZ56540.1 hypothetical protein GPECTOR_1g485 [Gonium pectorale]
MQLGDLRRSGVIGSRETLRSSLAYPGLSPNFLNEPLDGVLSDTEDADDLDQPGGEWDEGDGVGSTARLSASARRAGVRGSSPDQGPGSDHQYNATAAARAALLHEKPAVVERMEKGVAACAVLRDNRHFRLNSLGVFQPGVNDVRARSMHRVELHKHLSTVNLRAPQPDKEVRSALQQDTIGTRLERMYNKVLRAGPAAAGGAGGAGTGGGGAGGFSGGGTGLLGGGGDEGGPFGGSPWGTGVMGAGTVSSLATGTLERSGAGGGTGRAAGGGGGGHAARKLVFNGVGASGGGGGGHAGTAEGRSSSLGGGGGGGGGGGAGPGPGSEAQQRHGSPRVKHARAADARSTDYWMRVTLPPEIIEAQLRHLAATTEAHLRTYHERVAAAQDALLADSGLGPGALGLPSEQVEQALKVKLGQIQEDSTDTSYNYSSLSREAVLASRLGAASKALLTAATLPAFIKAALEHVAQHSGELGSLRAARGAAGPEATASETRFRRRTGVADVAARAMAARGDKDDGSGQQDKDAAKVEQPAARWRPPGMALLAGQQQPGSGAAAPPPTVRRPDAEITDEWLAAFREEMEGIEHSTPDAPPEGLVPLPPLPPGDMDAGAYVRCRLERLWGVLEMPPALRLDMVLYFTARERALSFGSSLALWEQAAAAVLSREAQVEALVALQREVDAGGAPRLSLGGVAALCGRVLQLTRWVAVLAGRLRADSGWTLTRGSAPYPGEGAIGPDHLLAFMEQLRSATEGTGMRP